MDTFSDVSSVSFADSMPTLVDEFGNVVDDDQTTLPIYPEGPDLNQHIYFNEEGNEISREEFLANEAAAAEAFDDEEEEDQAVNDFIWLKTPWIRQRFVLKDPETLLAFLRFMDLFNKTADSEDILMIQAIPQNLINQIRAHPMICFPSADFADHVDELLNRLESHGDLSELYWGE